MWSTDSLWVEVAVVMMIFAVGGVLVGHFEAHKPVWRRLSKIGVVTVVTVLISATAGRLWAWLFVAVPLAGALYVHLVWLPRHGIDGWTGEPREKYLELMERRRGEKLSP
jgi:hypothetical protein